MPNQRSMKRLSAAGVAVLAMDEYEIVRSEVLEDQEALDVRIPEGLIPSIFVLITLHSEAKSDTHIVLLCHACMRTNRRAITSF